MSNSGTIRQASGKRVRGYGVAKVISDSSPAVKISSKPRRRRGADALFESLRGRIANHSLPPGSKLRESQFASEFGVSRGRIREIFGALEQRGLIERIPNRGAVVSRLDLKNALDLYEVREYAEALCARLATCKAPEGVWDDLLQKIESFLGHELADREVDLYLSYLEELNARMIQYADNPLLSYILDLIHDKSQVLARRVVVLPGRLTRALPEHRALLQAMKARDSDDAERILRKNLSSARGMLEKYKRVIF